MSWQYFFLTGFLTFSMLMITGIALYFMYQSQLHQQKLLSSFQSSMKDLTNLLVSKDPMTFAQMQQIPSTSQIQEMIRQTTSNLDPQLMSDEAIAQRMANSLKLQGQDPNMAYDREALEELGLNFT